MWEQEQQQRCLLSPNELDLDDMERLNFHGEELIKKQIAATQQNTSRRLLRAISLVQAGGAAAGDLCSKSLLFGGVCPPAHYST